jgi:putative membrane protein
VTAPASTLLLVGIAAGVCAAYLTGARRLAAAPAGSPGRSWAWRRWAFCAGAAVVVLTLAPPLDPLVDDSFPLHMVQHMVLIFAAAPLLALGAPGLPLLLALPRRWRRRAASLRDRGPVRLVRATPDLLPAVGLAAFTLVLVVWHLPAVYTAALDAEPVHVAEHLSFLGAAWLLWAPLAAPGRAALDGGRAVLYVFLGGFPMLPVGAVLVMATRPLYPAQTGTGPGAVAAQQLAGVLMWVPPTFLTVGLAAVVVLRWFARMERADPGGAPLPPPVLPDALAPRGASR